MYIHFKKSTSSRHNKKRKGPCQKLEGAFRDLNYEFEKQLVLF